MSGSSFEKEDIMQERTRVLVERWQSREVRVVTTEDVVAGRVV